jgi:aminoglycoside phosphotransferase (APT) family kinase protein
MAPEPMWMGDGSLGGEFYVVRRYDGENVPRRLLRDEQYAQARAALPSQLAGVLAKIHAIDPDSIGGVARPADTPSVAEQALDKHVQLLRAVAPEPHPAFELAFRWLRTRLPDPKTERRTFVHGDFRVGNVLFGPEGMRAMLDWEIAHVGDPMEDLSWVCVRSWRFGGDKPVGGIGTREEFFAAYEAASGVKVDPDVHRWWEIFGNLRWGIICISQAKVYLDGISKSLELAAIGRRTSETEWELMELMDGKT